MTPYQKQLQIKRRRAAKHYHKPMTQETYEQATRLADEINRIDSDLQSIDSILVKLRNGNHAHGILIRFDVESVLTSKEKSTALLRSLSDMFMRQRQALISELDAL